MSAEADISAIATLFAERVRADMALALLGERALTAGEMARAAGASASAASPHLARLVEGGVVIVERRGRHRYYRLADPAIAHLLEVMLTMAPSRPISTLTDAQRREKLWVARTCYDHLAGCLGVDLFDSIIAMDLMRLNGGELTPSPGGIELFASFGLDVDGLQGARRPFALPCLDWTERRHHLAGALGAALLRTLLENGSLRRSSTSRAVQVTESGTTFLNEVFGVRLRSPGTAQFDLPEPRKTDPLCQLVPRGRGK